MLTDPFGRNITYLRLSVTDRCDFRCVYCMAEDMTFLSRKDILSLEELREIAAAFVELGGQKIRLTGGEPLVRNGIDKLTQAIGSLPGLKELALTTNGSQLHRYAQEFKRAGVTSINISIDSLQAERFRQLTRTGDLKSVLRGIDAALEAGIERLRLNSVIMNGHNDDEIEALVDFALAKDLDIAFIEEMPLGIMESERDRRWLSNDTLFERLSQRFDLSPCEGQESNSGPARYQRVKGSSTRIGFISPHTNNFCGSCNRIRITVEGRLLLCLGNEHSVDLRSVLRSPNYSRSNLKTVISDALHIKPERHHFYDPSEPQIIRFMNATGG
jgi:cyclic pyranopterin phosphate synthase